MLRYQYLFDVRGVVMLVTVSTLNVTGVGCCMPGGTSSPDMFYFERRDSPASPR